MRLIASLEHDEWENGSENYSAIAGGHELLNGEIFHTFTTAAPSRRAAEPLWSSFALAFFDLDLLLLLRDLRWLW
jgi:hypothetical protein